MRKAFFMKSKTVAGLSVLMLFSCFAVSDAFAVAKKANEEKVEAPRDRLMREYKEYNAKQAEKKRKETAKKSVWDDNSNPYFKSGRPKPKKDETVVEEDGPRRSTFKRRVYDGPRKEEIFEAAVKKATENFNSFMTSEDFTVQYDNISYNVDNDTLSVSEVIAIPKQKNIKEVPVPYLMRIKDLSLRSFNIGEVEQTPIVKDDGELTARKIEIPIWDEKGVKKGKVDIANLFIKGEIVSFLQKREGEYQSLEIRNLRSEKIINETILNNIIRSKVFSASSADFKNGKIKKELYTALKEQRLNGFEFSEARVNGQPLTTMDGVSSAMISYSARILNTDMVWGARLEAKKGKSAEPDPEQFKKNVEENKAAIKELEKK